MHGPHGPQAFQSGTLHDRYVIDQMVCRHQPTSQAQEPPVENPGLAAPLTVVAAQMDKMTVVRAGPGSGGAPAPTSHSLKTN